MMWLQAFYLPFEKDFRTATLWFPAVATFGFILYNCVVAGAFLAIVGIHPMALGMTQILLGLSSLTWVCLMVGYLWYQTDFDHSRDIGWGQYFKAGLQLLLFYSFLMTFLVSLGLLLGPLGLPFALVSWMLHPVLIYPMIGARQDKSFLGLFDACLDIPRLFTHSQSGTFWKDCLVYGSIHGLLFLPLSSSVCILSGIGVLLLPGLFTGFIKGFAAIFDQYDLTPQSAHRPPTLQLGTLPLSKPSAETYYSSNAWTQPSR